MEHETIRVSPCVASCVDDQKNKIYLEVELPGVDKEGIKLTVHEDSFYLTAARRDGYMEYSTSYALCCPVKAEEARAKYENGLLKIELPFKEALEGAVNITVE